MKTFKKVLALLLVAALAAGIAVVGTVAYFTHEDEDINVFTIGNVKVELVELQRNEARTALEDFKDGKQLMPIVGSAQGDKDDYGMPIADNYVDKIVYATNKGESDAFMRIRVAIPTWENTSDDKKDAGKNNLHWNTTDTTTQNKLVEEMKLKLADSEYDITYDLEKPITIGGETYTVYTFTFVKPIEPGYSTKAVMSGLYLDKRVDYNPESRMYEDINGQEFSILNNKVNVPVIVEAIQADGFDTDYTAAFAAGNFPENPWAVTVSDSDGLADAIENAEDSTTIELEKGNYTTNMKIDGGSDIAIIGNGDGTVLSGQIATTSSTAGTITLKNLTIKVDSSIKDSTGISQTGKSAIAIWGNQTVICENVTFDMSLSDSTAITSWWDTNEGTTIIVRNCTFNCNGQRPIRATGNVTVENCTFNDPYRYAVQLTAKASTATELDKAIINFNDNTIVNGEGGKAFVYGIQLEGADYGCNDCIINGSGNAIVDGGTDSAMYYCECGKVQHETIVWNTEVPAVHEKN